MLANQQISSTTLANTSSTAANVELCLHSGQTETDQSNSTTALRIYMFCVCVVCGASLPMLAPTDIERATSFMTPIGDVPFNYGRVFNVRFAVIRWHADRCAPPYTHTHTHWPQMHHKTNGRKMLHHSARGMCQRNRERTHSHRNSSGANGHFLVNAARTVLRYFFFSRHHLFIHCFHVNCRAACPLHLRPRTIYAIHN